LTPTQWGAGGGSATNKEPSHKKPTWRSHGRLNSNPKSSKIWLPPTHPYALPATHYSCSYKVREALPGRTGHLGTTQLSRLHTHLSGVGKENPPQTSIARKKNWSCLEILAANLSHGLAR
jgi:hypothetical protein